MVTMIHVNLSYSATFDLLRTWLDFSALLMYSTFLVLRINVLMRLVFHNLRFLLFESESFSRSIVMP